MADEKKPKIQKSERISDVDARIILEAAESLKKISYLGESGRKAYLLMQVIRIVQSMKNRGGESKILLAEGDKD
jgi:hypothetical protein